MAQGAMGDTMYLIISGTVSVKATRPGERHPQELMQLTHPSYFGERVLLEQAAAHTLRTSTHTALLPTLILTYRAPTRPDP